MVGNTLLQKTWSYKSFSPAGVYLGLIQNVSTPFNYNQLIGTAFAQIQFTVEQSADVAGLVASPITDELGNAITDESGNQLLIERQPDVVGSSNSKALIANNNLLQVWEYSNYYPNGILKFSGYIAKWKTTFGATDDILVTAISNGQDLSQYIVQEAPILDQSQLLTNGNTTINRSSPITIQSISTTAGQTVLNRVTLQLASAIANNPTCTVALYASATTGLGNLARAAARQIPDATATATISSTSPANYDFIFNYTYPISEPGYFVIVISTSDGNGVKLYYQSGSPYAGGDLSNPTNTFPFDGTCSLYFDSYYSSNATNATYTNDDPSFIMNDLITNVYNRYGGLITPAGAFSNTNTLTTYTFKMQTVLQAIQTTVGLAPATWYWFVDPAAGTLTFAKTSTTANITLIKGRHINEIDIEASKEGIINLIYFSGGDDGTGTSTNILVKVLGTLGLNRVGLALLSDNRVNSTSGGVTTARLIANNYINTNNAETYITNVTIQDQTMDINLIKLGQTIGFSGFGNFVDQLLLQVVGLNYQGDQVVLQLGSLPKRSSKSFADAEAALAYLQTVAVNTTPS
jgi:hypothetical protein